MSSSEDEHKTGDKNDRRLSAFSRISLWCGISIAAIGVLLRVCAPTFATPFMLDHPRPDTLAFLVGASYVLLAVGAFLVLLAIFLRRVSG